MEITCPFLAKPEISGSGSTQTFPESDLTQPIDHLRPETATSRRWPSIPSAMGTSPSNDYCSAPEDVTRRPAFEITWSHLDQRASQLAICAR
jgi:hypothetical protein